MGWLDNLVQDKLKTVAKTVGQAVDEVIDDSTKKAAEGVAKTLKDGFSQAGIELKETMNGGKEKSEATGSMTVEEKVLPEGDLSDYFAGILAENFSEFQVKKNLAAAELNFAGAELQAKKYDFVLFQNEKVKAVMMLTPHNRDNNMAFKNARAASEKAGVPFINFYTHYDNEKSYVIQRIKKFLA